MDMIVQIESFTCDYFLPDEIVQIVREAFENVGEDYSSTKYIINKDPE